MLIRTNARTNAKERERKRILQLDAEEENQKEVTLVKMATLKRGIA